MCIYSPRKSFLPTKYQKFDTVNFPCTYVFHIKIWSFPFVEFVMNIQGGNNFHFVMIQLHHSSYHLLEVQLTGGVCGRKWHHIPIAVPPIPACALRLWCRTAVSWYVCDSCCRSASVYWSLTFILTSIMWRILCAKFMSFFRVLWVVYVCTVFVL